AILLNTDTVAIRDVLCLGTHQQKSAEETSRTTHLVFPYRGVYVRHLGSDEAVAEANQVLFFNAAEDYRVSHPVKGGDASLSIWIDEHLLRELSPKHHQREGGGLKFRPHRLRIDPRAQALVALLRHSLTRKVAETLEAETLTFTLVRRALGDLTSHAARSSFGRQKLVDRAKLVLASDLGRRWTLADIAAAVGVSPVYLTQAFAQVEAVPLYRYQLRLRLARALDLLSQYDNLTTLSLELGFSSHSHFSAAFRQAYGRTPAEFQRSVRLR
ncbi:MAG TPA: AraC family transcriptional regulator, partial [Gemmatimonadales bacterium]|nr:AraC family transcriptional regulator [Gemmatimonadales bacterium]